MTTRNQQIQTNYRKLKAEIESIACENGRNPRDITLVAVSKGHPFSDIQAVYEAGCRDVGESRLQEAVEKLPQSPADLRWHYIGTLQSKKVNKVISHFSLIHSVDTPTLAKQISQSAQRMEITASILLQVNTSGELSKHGLSPQEWKTAFPDLLSLSNLRIEGLMTMAPLTEDTPIIRECFRNLRLFRDDLASRGQIALPHLSMGMSHDYPIAIAEGATLLRIGSALFS